MLDMWQPELARVHLRFNTALRWCAGLLALAWVLPVRVAWDHTVWSWELLDRPAAIPAAMAPLMMAAVLLLLARSKKLDALFKAGIALAAAVAGSWLVAKNPDTGEALFYGFPPQIRSNGWLLTVALICSGAASVWTAGPRQGARARQPSRVLGFVSLGLVALLLFWPTRGSFLIVTYLRSVWEIVGPSGFIVPRTSLAVNLGLALLPLLVVEITALWALSGKGTRIGWIVALPPFVILMWSMKIAMGAGSDATFGVGLRVAVFFAAQLVLGVFALHVVMAQLLDVHVPEILATTGLLRDALLSRALAEGRDPKTAADGYRPWVQRLVSERFESVSLVNQQSRTGGDVLSRIRLRLSGVLQEDVQPLTPEQVAERVEKLQMPRVSGWIDWLARGRRLEAVGSVIAVVVIATVTLTQWLVVPKAPQWVLGDAPSWAKVLYEQELPRLAIAASYLKEPEGPAEYAKAVEKAVSAAQPVPALATAIKEISVLADDPGANRRAMLRAAERLNAAARDAHLPYYADINVKGYYDRTNKPAYVFYFKTYDIEKVRIAHVGRASYEALRLERLDNTNVEELRLGWRKDGAPYAMIIQDVIREFWIQTMLPALTNQNADFSLGDATRMKDDVVQSLVETGFTVTEAQKLVQDALRCRTLAVTASYGQGEERSEDEIERCTDREITLEAKMVPILDRMVEGHELQHQIDGESLRPPDAVWRAMGGSTDEPVLRATNELSAYLAEIARAPSPRIALAHFRRVGQSGFGGPEFVAWQVAEPVLSAGLADGASLTSVGNDELRRRALKAYESLFGSPLAELHFDDAERQTSR